MKFVSALLSLLTVSSAAASAPEPQHLRQVPLHDIAADSGLGLKLLGKARKLSPRELEDMYGEQYNQDFNEEFLNTWVAGYSIKFQGCHHISQWNDEVDEDEDVRIVTKRLVRFRLCPTSYCMGGSQGCSNGYGDYIIDLNTFLESYMEARQYANQDQAQAQYAENGEYNYNANNEMAYQVLENYLECSQADFRRTRKLDQNQYNYNNNGQNYNGQDYNNNGQNYNGQDYNNNGQNYQNQNYQQQQDNGNYEYYIGPYCASQGGAVYLGVFIDDSCSTFADDNGGRDTYLAQTGSYLPFTSESIVGTECISCSESGENENYNYYENDQEDADDVLELCETMYDLAGKCEANLPYGTSYDPNNNACNYMEGIKIIRQDGTVMTAQSRANKSASVVLTFLTLGFAGMCAYVYFLKQKLDRSSITLNEE